MAACRRPRRPGFFGKKWQLFSFYGIEFKRRPMEQLVAMALDEDDADRFHRQARVCRDQSEKARDLIDAASWLRLADDFERLAERERLRCHHALERRLGALPPS
jgi:hypothetical protein